MYAMIVSSLFAARKNQHFPRIRRTAHTTSIHCANWHIAAQTILLSVLEGLTLANKQHPDQVLNILTVVMVIREVSSTLSSRRSTRQPLSARHSQGSCVYLSISSNMKSFAPRSTMVQEACVFVPLKKINSPSPTRCSDTLGNRYVRA